VDEGRGVCILYQDNRLLHSSSVLASSKGMEIFEVKQETGHMLMLQTSLLNSYANLEEPCVNV
jgi:hypothetical protein